MQHLQVEIKYLEQVRVQDERAHTKMKDDVKQRRKQLDRVEIQVQHNSGGLDELEEMVPRLQLEFKAQRNKLSVWKLRTGRGNSVHRTLHKLSNGTSPNLPVSQYSFVNTNPDFPLPSEVHIPPTTFWGSILDTSTLVLRHKETSGGSTCPLPEFMRPSTKHLCLVKSSGSHQFNALQHSPSRVPCARNHNRPAQNHANLLPIPLVLLNTCHRAIVRLTADQSSGPLHNHVRRAATRYVGSHRTSLHHLTRQFCIVP
ncbi:hypothetical protein BDR04DRAFT_1165267 [Suillus decipiens]|nr:hypothetical protein BDR04DRAFT_1165267 [Suillus decipiens]